MNPRTYAEVLHAGSEPITGLCGRIIRGTKPDDFLTLTDDPTRKLVMFMGEDGLSTLVGKSGHDMLVEIGYEKDYIAHKIKDGNQFKLIVFPEGDNVKLATWENTINMVSATYPGTSTPLFQAKETLELASFNNIERAAGFSFSEVDRIGPEDPRYMTFERFKSSEGTAIDVRSFLYYTVHLRELFSGDGFTYTYEGKRGLKEYIGPNIPIASIEDHILIDLDVRIPA